MLPDSHHALPQVTVISVFIHYSLILSVFELLMSVFFDQHLVYETQVDSYSDSLYFFIAF